MIPAIQIGIDIAWNRVLESFVCELLCDLLTLIAVAGNLFFSEDKTAQFELKHMHELCRVHDRRPIINNLYTVR